jgi:menaquinol-cytochrome c reductase iron-sulfur subunit
LAASLGLLAAGLAFFTPLATGIAAFLNPWRQKGRAGQSLRLATLDTLPEDGTPVKATVLMDEVDAWNRVPNQPVGAVFLRRVGLKGVEALNVVCPHAGCSIEYKEEIDPATGGKVKKFFCPCHTASFDLSGKRIDAVSPSPRDMDRLTVDPDRLAVDGEVWVEFKNFQSGIAKQVPLA